MTTGTACDAKSFVLLKFFYFLQFVCYSGMTSNSSYTVAMRVHCHIRNVPNGAFQAIYFVILESYAVIVL